MAKTVLIIEDSATDAAIVKDLLEKEGLEVHVANTGKKGMEEARKLIPDLIILDLMLPDMTGYEVCRQVKEDATLDNTIVVILSIKDDVSDITAGFKSGADDYIIKPPIPDFIAKKVKLYLGIR
ncbi:MAG: response regulator [Candidatus Omnitrophota bacterium]